MSEKFTIEIISPARTILKTQTTEVIIPSYEGEMGILKDHVPLITFLRPGLVKIIGEKEKKYFVEDGTVEFFDNYLLILTSTAKEITNLESKNIEIQIKDAEEKIKADNISDKEKYLLSYKIETLKNIN